MTPTPGRDVEAWGEGRDGLDRLGSSRKTNRGAEAGLANIAQARLGAGERGVPSGPVEPGTQLRRVVTARAAEPRGSDAGSVARGGSPPARRRRSDRGTIRFWERDGELLSFVGEQYAVTVAQLAQRMGVRAPTAINLRDRWRRAGWVESHALLWRGPAFVWLTKEGSRVSQSPYRPLRPNPGLALHTRAVTDVRLLVEHELGLGEWECERALARLPRSSGAPLPHLPDAVLETPRGRIAIEVELSLKSPARLELILAELGRRYPEVWYFAAARVAPTLRRATSLSPWRHIAVYPFPPRAEELHP